MIEIEKTSSSEQISVDCNTRKNDRSDNIGAVIMRTSLEMYESFKKAYRYIESEDFGSAKMKFEKLIADKGEIVSTIHELTDKRKELLLEKNILDAVILIFDVMSKSMHNLWVIATESRCAEDEAKLYDKEAYLKAELAFYKRIMREFFGAFAHAEDEARLVHKFCKPLSELYFFAFCIECEERVLEKYLRSIKGKERMHCYNVYRELVKNGERRIIDKLNTVGEYLCKTIDDLSTMRIIYHSIFYESAALEYAYKNGLCDITEKILRNGYDYYFELDTLYIIWFYDRQQFYREMLSLKRLCLKRGINLTEENYFHEYRYIRKVYGDDFCDDFVAAALEALNALELAAVDDPRLNDGRRTPDWAV